ncbi:MAG: proprotein convertase P-domain-containing protein [Bacteroidia bacterium]|nr:proprotein convertase P-domain-containing protein [Bacteroidia bacterium]
MDNKALMQEEMERRAPGRAPKFAKTVYSNIKPSTHGNWEVLPNGNSLWRMRISSAGAKSLNLGFTSYQMPKGGSMILYTPDKKEILGPFTPSDNEDHAQLWTPVLKGEELVIEVQIPQAQKSNLQLTLNSINHDFLGFSTLLSGSCNIDVICGAADGLGIIDRYRDIIQSVGVYGFNGSTFCTGFLVNNTAQDCRPFFMTADHCGVTAGNAPSMVVYWNFQNSTCRTPGSGPSGGNGNGTLTTSNSGAIYRAGWSGSDFALVELDDPINPAANAYFAGWDISTSFSTDSVVCVHHPNTDEKRISFEYDNTFIGTQGGNSDPNSNYIVVSDWDMGTTEGGSSGAPLFDKNGKVIGQLFGGLAACNNSQYDSFGWMRRSWTGAGSSSTRLSDWLDPTGSGVEVLDGRNCANAILASPSVASTCSPAEVVFSLEAGQGFTGNVSLSLSGLPAGFSGTFSQNPIVAGGTTSLSVQVPMGYNGTVNFDINATDGVENSTTPLTINATNVSPVATSPSSPADDATNVSTVASLEWVNQAGMEYEVQVSSDSNFLNILSSGSNLSANSYQISSGVLQEEITYYWRVRSTNPCGESAWSSTFSFTTGALFCDPYTVSNLGITISPNGTSTVNSAQLVQDNGTVSGIKISNLGITHTWVGDLIIRLISPAGTSVTVYAEPFCDEGNLLLSFDDDAFNSYSVLEGICNTTSPAISGTFQPQESLSAFVGESINGLWTLEVEDNANGDGGSLDQWTLEICTVTGSSFAISTEEVEICAGDTVDFSLTLGNSFQGAPISLTANNLPLGAAASFDPSSGTANSTANGRLFGFNAAGDYTVEIVAANGFDNRSQNIIVHVEDVPNISLVSPDDQIGGRSINPTLIWNAVDNANSYRVEIASDNAFTNILNSQVTTDTSWTTPDLAYGTNYFWRVVGINECGEAANEVRSFGTDFQTGLEDELGGVINLFPNPNQGQIKIQLPSPAMEDLKYSLYSLEGKLIFSGSWQRGLIEKELNLSELGEGVYLLNLQSATESWNKKLVRTP